MAELTYIEQVAVGVAVQDARFSWRDGTLVTGRGVPMRIASALASDAQTAWAVKPSNRFTEYEPIKGCEASDGLYFAEVVHGALAVLQLPHSWPSISAAMHAEARRRFGRREKKQN